MKSKPIIPIDRQTFISRLKNIVFIHLALMLVFFIAREFVGEAHQFYLLVVFTIGIVLNAIRLTPSEASRLKDLYPDKNFNFVIPFSMMFFSVVFQPLLIYICLKEKSDGAVPKLLRMPFAVPMALVVVSCSFYHSKIAYFIASPTIYYVSNLAQSVFKINELSKKVEGNSEMSLSRLYYETYQEKAKSVEVVILLAESAKDLGTKRTRAIASAKENKDEISTKYGLMLLQDMFYTIEINNKASLELTDYGPLQWLNPVAMLEICLLSGVELIIKEASKPKFEGLFIESVSKMETSFNKMDPSLKAKYENSFMQLKYKASQFESSRSIASEK